LNRLITYFNPLFEIKRRKQLRRFFLLLKDFKHLTLASVIIVNENDEKDGSQADCLLATELRIESNLCMQATIAILTFLPFLMSLS
jgi:hypothetical protein